jgi:hypothetical protein
MKASSVVTQARVHALSPEYASLPARSRATFITLAETVRPGEGVESPNGPRGLAKFIKSLLNAAPFSTVGLGGKISIVFTPGGPLVYQWDTNSSTDADALPEQ